MFYIIGLGNPGEEYELTRHNTGRLALAEFVRHSVSNMEFDKKLNALASSPTSLVGGKKEKFQILFPETFMNKSGLTVKQVVKSQKATKNLIVVHDDLDLPLGRFKISFAKDSAGHKGIESIIKNIKTKEFIRIRVGISPVTPSGKTKKPDSKKILDFIIGKFKPAELAIIKKESKRVAIAIETILQEGLQKAMSVCH